MTREEDFDLVRQLCGDDAAGRAAAFDVLYRKYRDRVFNTAFRVLNDHALAADVTQETFISILRKAKKFNFRSAFSSWLYRVAVNLCIDAGRRRSRRRPLSLSEPEISVWAEESDKRRDPEDGPEMRARKAELSYAVRAAISGLNPKLASVVVLRYVEGMGYEEIAEVLDMPIGTVKSRLNRAHTALESQLRDALRDYTQEK